MALRDMLFGNTKALQVELWSIPVSAETCSYAHREWMAFLMDDYPISLWLFIVFGHHTWGFPCKTCFWLTVCHIQSFCFFVHKTSHQTDVWVKGPLPRKLFNAFASQYWCVLHSSSFMLRGGVCPELSEASAQSKMMPKWCFGKRKTIEIQPLFF